MSQTNQPTNIFAMFQKNPNCHYPGVRIDFTQIKDQAESITKGKNVFKKIIPSYNNDGLYFTDAFILESDSIKKFNPQADSSENLLDEDSKYKFESKVQKENASMEIQEIYPAEPDSFFCQICRASFDNYIQHIEGRDHVRNLEFSKGHKFIKEICKQAKKYFSCDQTDKVSSTSIAKQKSKSISQKKGVLKNLKKNQKSERKATKKNNTIEKEGVQESKQKWSEDLRSIENDEQVSIINGQMKLSAVEKPKIQNMD